MRSSSDSRFLDSPPAVRPATAEIAGFLQEAMPGRRYQRALQQERVDLPKFRRFGNEPAFVDGWSLYAILKDGAMPLDILEAKMKLWMEVRR